MGQPAPDAEPTWPLRQPPGPPEQQYPGDHGQSAYPIPYGYDHHTYGPPGQPTGPAYPEYAYDPRQQAYLQGLQAAQKSRLAAGLLAIFLGGLGVHNFYLGRTGIGVVQLLLTVLSLGFLAPLVWIWVLVEAILILTRSPSFAADAKGVPLRD